MIATQRKCTTAQEENNKVLKGSEEREGKEETEVDVPWELVSKVCVEATGGQVTDCEPRWRCPDSRCNKASPTNVSRVLAAQKAP